MMIGEREEGEAELDEVDEDLLQQAFNNEELSEIQFQKFEENQTQLQRLGFQDDEQSDIVFNLMDSPNQIKNN